MMKPEKQIRYVASGNYLISELGEDSVLLSMDNSAYYRLNPVSNQIWKLILEPRSIPEVVDELQEQFDIDKSTCTREVTEFIEQLVEKGLASQIDREDAGS